MAAGGIYLRLVFEISCILLLSTCARAFIRNTDLPPLFNDSLHPLSALEYQHEHEANDSRAPCDHYAEHVEYVLLQNGSLVLPGSDGVYDSYYLVNDTAFLCTSEEDELNATEPVYSFSKDFLSCGKLLIAPHEFRLLDNGDVYVETYRMTYGPMDYFIKDDSVYVCIPPFDEMKRNRTDFTPDKFDMGFVYVSYAGLLVSVVCLMSHLAVFSLLPSARNLPGCCLASLSLSLLVAYCCYLASSLVDEKHLSCSHLGICIYYFFLTSFFWMNAIAYDIWRSFRSVMRELRISSQRLPWKRFLLYSLYAWTVPALLACLARLVDTTDILPEEFRPQFGSGFCWFGQRRALLVFFALPLVVVMVTNAAFFLDVTCVISRAALNTAHEANLRKRFFMFMRLALIMGLTWIVGLVAAFANHVALWYAFVVLNTLQGLFIFVVFSCSSKVKGMLCCRQKYNSKKRGSTSVRISHISAQV